MKWILDHVEGARLRAANGELLFGTVDSYLIWQLTGERVHATDATNAARTMLYDIRKGRWSATICALLDRKSPRADGKSYTTQITYVADRPGHDRRYAIDCAKIQSELGWSPRESFETGLAKTVDWYLANRIWTDDITKTRYQRERLGSAK